MSQFHNSALKTNPYHAKRFFYPGIMLAIIVMLVSSGSFAQRNSGTLIANETTGSDSTGTLKIEINNLNFYRNNEYMSKIVDGYTLPGTWIRPKLVYYPDNKFRMELGVHALSFHGLEKTRFYPWFSAIYKPTGHITFRMGNLDQDLNHGLPEPVMDSEHILIDKPEAGFQGKVTYDNWNFDGWIDWQKMIFRGDPFKERFVFGITSSVVLFQNEEKKLSLPILFHGSHEGGEIDIDPGPVETHIALSEGLRYEYQTGGSLVKSGRLEFNFLQSTYPQSKTPLPGKSGIGFFLQTAMNTDYGTFSTGYWQGENFYAPMGNLLYQNGVTTSSISTPRNRLLVFSYSYDHVIFLKSKFGMVSDLFYNPHTGRFSNSAALYLMVNLSFLVKKIAK